MKFQTCLVGFPKNFIAGAPFQDEKSGENVEKRRHIFQNMKEVLDQVQSTLEGMSMKSGQNKIMADLEHGF